MNLEIIFLTNRYRFLRTTTNNEKRTTNNEQLNKPYAQFIFYSN